MKTINVINKKSFIEKMIGLLDKKITEPIFYRTRFGVHTFFMKYPIQIIILDAEDIVIKTAILQPNRLFFWSPNFNRVIETPLVNGKASSEYEVGDKLDLRYI